MLDNIPYLPYFISAFIGIGLAAASGFRVFLPMFAVSLASYMGWIPMNENFQWLAGLPTLITTGIATVVEILAYYIPYVDHLLDTASVPLATIAGSIMFAAQFTDLGTFPTWAAHVDAPIIAIVKYKIAAKINCKINKNEVIRNFLLV